VTYNAWYEPFNKGIREREGLEEDLGSGLLDWPSNRRREWRAWTEKSMMTLAGRMPG
jgi:hypothetical protein